MLNGKRKKISLFSVVNVSPAKLTFFFTNLNFENSFVIRIWLFKNHEQVIFEYELASIWCFFWPKGEKTYFFLWIFRKYGHFLGLMSGGFFFFKLCCSRSYHYVLITKKINIYRISNYCLQFSLRWSKNTKLDVKFDLIF